MFPIRSWSRYGEKNGKAGNAGPAIWDASALVPLCVRQDMTPQAIALYRTHDAVVWWVTPVEIASALARLKACGPAPLAAFRNRHQAFRSTASPWR